MPVHVSITIDTKVYFHAVHGSAQVRRKFRLFGTLNDALDVCIYWDIPNEMMPGFYIVELYVEEVLIGKTSFDLK